MMGVGLAVAGGLAAGVLAGKLLEHRRETHHDAGDLDRIALALSPIAFDSDARELQDRPVDFGNGNDWDAQSPDAGATDFGSGEDDAEW